MQPAPAPSLSPSRLPVLRQFEQVQRLVKMQARVAQTYGRLDTVRVRFLKLQAQVRRQANLRLADPPVSHTEEGCCRYLATTLGLGMTCGVRDAFAARLPESKLELLQSPSADLRVRDLLEAAVEAVETNRFRPGRSGPDHHQACFAQAYRIGVELVRRALVPETPQRRPVIAPRRA